LRISVRKATLDDLGWLLGQLREFSRFLDTELDIFGDDEYVGAAVRNLIQNHVVFISESEDVGPTGMIAGLLMHHPFNPGINVLAEQFWWVDPKYRGTRSGILLLDIFTRWAREIRIDCVAFGLEENSPINDRCLTKRGYRLKERTYVLEVKT
jgi:RimJ/RimL family protein N-acetyltransferase